MNEASGNSLENKSQNFSINSILHNSDNLMPVFGLLILVSLFNNDKSGSLGNIVSMNNSPKSNDKNIKLNTYEMIEKTEGLINSLSKGVDLMRKVNRLSDVRSTASSRNNLNNMEEAFSIIKSIVPQGETNNKFNKIDNSISSIKRLNEFKTLFEVQKNLGLFNNLFKGNKSQSNNENNHDNSDNNNSLEGLASKLLPMMKDNNNGNENVQKVAEMAELLTALMNKK